MQVSCTYELVHLSIALMPSNGLCDPIGAACAAESFDRSCLKPISLGGHLLTDFARERHVDIHI
jgi:hypothetical protein